MAGHEWGDWFEREELIGQISDIRVQNLQVEKETKVTEQQNTGFWRKIVQTLDKVDKLSRMHVSTTCIRAHYQMAYTLKGYTLRKH
ncbi:Calmin [Anabarilius grahami]|uniref:Calmin n=1 Tax=Anabarilius grahami TaxID=495550 RepID=A0A3N0XVH9_ANAGA|nr:Calmin [Anabarilius grahami]